MVKPGPSELWGALRLGSRTVLLVRDLAANEAPSQGGRHEFSTAAPWCPLAAPNLLTLLTFETIADCQHFYGGSIGRHGGSIERWSRRW